MGEGDAIGQARQGDRVSAAALITAELPYWMAAARQIVNGDPHRSRWAARRIDPADLVQDAIVKLLDAWRRGQGPDSNVRAYVTATMRNDYINALRSPRAREQLLETPDEQTALATADDLQQIDLTAEREIVGRAFSRLSPDHREVLQAITVNGLKPADLVVQLGRPAPAISNLLARAKQALRRLVLIELLKEGAAECRQNADSLPPNVHDDFGGHRPSDRGLAHVRECERCQDNWRRFAAMASALGILPLLVVTELTTGSTPAQAAPDGNSAPTAHPHASLQAPLGRAGVSAVLSSRTMLAVSVLALAVGGFATSAFLIGSHSSQSTAAAVLGSEATPAAGVDFDVHLDTGDDEALRAIRVVFTASDRSDWSVQSLTLTLTPGTRIRTAPAGMMCRTQGTSTVCRPTGEPPLTGELAFTVDNPAHGGEFALAVVATKAGLTYEGDGNGHW